MEIKPLNANAIKSAIEHPNIRDIHVFDVLDSSNTWALQHANCGEACLTEQQTAGRGRRGRAWYSPQQSNLYLSLKWCFDEIPKHFGLLSLVVGVVIAKCLKQEGLDDHKLKWPNDIIFQGKKLGGILLETKGNPCHVVIGIGLNIAMQDGDIDQPWTSLNKLLKKTPDRNTLAAKILSALSKLLSSFQQLNTEEFINEWNNWDALQNKHIDILSDKSIISAQVIGIDNQGLLTVQLPNGIKQKLFAADVSIKAKNNDSPR